MLPLVAAVLLLHRIVINHIDQIENVFPALAHMMRKLLSALMVKYGVPPKRSK
jgi:hypothetical protein